MQRRNAIQSILWILASCPLKGVRAWAQSAMFPGDRENALRELAATVLPESLGRAATDRIADEFIRWVREYRQGAEMQTGYGNTRVSHKPKSPAGAYLAQLEQLAAGPLSVADLAERRTQLAAMLDAAQIKDLPFAPDARHIASDLMSFYFGSSEANDLAYGRVIGRDKCRTLKNSGQVPALLKRGS